jgi:GR25 family glycosyltransferase involved in LPS biosynthesis
VYRGWAITEVEDVFRIAPELKEQGLSDSEAWIAYEKMLSCWGRDHKDKYVDFFNRHMTLGECGSTLSHLSVCEAAARDNIDVQIIFEDDGRPTPATFPALIEQIEAMEGLDIDWDLIYLRSVKYDLRPEQRVEGTRLVRAAHRKCVDAYVVSARGAKKIAEAGLRDSMFPIDDFLPALHAHHPRPDVRRLPCVTAVTEGMGGLVAFAFPEGDFVCELEATDSDNNSSPCVVGDHGCEVSAGD